MTPDVNGLIVQHEQRFANSFLAVEVNSVTSLDELIVHNVVGSFLYVANECSQLLLGGLSNILEFVHSIFQPLIVQIAICVLFLFLMVP